MTVSLFIPALSREAESNVFSWSCPVETNGILGVSFLCAVFLTLNNKAKNELPIDDEETLEKNKWDTLTMRWGITAVHHKAEVYSPNLRLPSVTQNKGALFAIFDQSIVVLDYIAANICGIKKQQLYWQSKWALLSTKVHCICQVCKNIGSSGSDLLDTTCKKPHPINSADVIKDTPLAQAHNIIKIMRGPAHWHISISILKIEVTRISFI